jgi:hypothetical protein
MLGVLKDLLVLLYRITGSFKEASLTNPASKFDRR